jgi:hypothetical protein
MYPKCIRDVAMTWTSDKLRRYLLISADLKLKKLCSHVVFAIIAVTLMRIDTIAELLWSVLAAQTCTSMTSIASLKTLGKNMAEILSNPE